MIDNVKIIMVNIASVILAFFQPIEDFCLAVFILLVANYICGLLADIIKGEEWSKRKTLQFFTHAVMLYGLALLIFACGHFMHARVEATQVVGYLFYVAFFFYGTNVVRNLRSLSVVDSPMYKLTDFLYYLLTFKIVEKIPFLSGYVARKRGE
ncbi:MAG: phage holin family protein [Prevotella sp.]|nr:phage holin family protein [Prevotella sp.]